VHLVAARRWADEHPRNASTRFAIPVTCITHGGPAGITTTEEKDRQQDVALAELVREAQTVAAVAEQELRGERSMSYLLLIALGLLFLSASFLISQSTARTALVALACFAFLIAVILTIVGTVGVSVG
jgi:hypothetical protein